MAPAATPELRIALLPTMPFHAGISMQVYAADLRDALARVPGVRADLVTPPFAGRPGPGWARSRWIRYVSYPAWAAAQRADLYHVVDHGNAQLLWRLPRARTVVTCHDLYPWALAAGAIRFPGAPARQRMLPTALRLLALRRAGTLLTVSHHTWHECRRYLGIPAARLRLVYESIPAAFSNPTDPEAVATTRARLGLQPDDLVVLHVGSNDPRKNVATVCRTVARLRATTRARVILLKVGPPLGAAELRLAGAGAGTDDGVRQVPRVSTAALVDLYQAATVLLYPSFYEGFCRPMVEAMTAGLPVVASTGGAIPEIADGAAALHDPLDVDALTASVTAIATEPARRAAQVAAGRARGRRFAAERHGHRVADVYREVARR